MSISSFVPSCCFHGYLSLRSVHYLSLPPFPSLSPSLCSYLSHFAFISASLPPALSHTLLTPAFISLHFHLSFTFLSPSSLPFHHAGGFFFSSYLWGESFIGFPDNSAFLIISNLSSLLSVPLSPALNSMCASVCVRVCVLVRVHTCVEWKHRCRSLFTIIKKEG